MKLSFVAQPSSRVFVVAVRRTVAIYTVASFDAHPPHTSIFAVQSRLLVVICFTRFSVLFLFCFISCSNFFLCISLSLLLLLFYMFFFKRLVLFAFSIFFAKREGKNIKSIFQLLKRVVCAVYARTFCVGKKRQH